MVRLPGTQLDTEHPADQPEILKRINSGFMTREELTDFRQDALQQIPQQLNRQLNAFEVDMLNQITVMEATLQDIENMYDLVRQEKSIWSMGRIILFDQTYAPQMAFVSQPAKASGGYVGDKYARVPNVSNAELEISLGDSEIRTLDHLYSYIHDQRVLATQGLTLLDIIISGNMGPCAACQGRITAFINDLKTMATQLRVRVALRLSVNYYTDTNWDNQKGRQYGYLLNVQTIRVANNYVYWSRVTTDVLGA